MTIEKLAWGNTFCSDNNIANNIEDKNTKEWVAEGIIYFIKEWFEKKNKEKNIAIEKQKKINEWIKRLLAKDTLTREDKEELLNIIEELYNLIENTEYYNDKRNKFIFEEYIKRSKDIWRSPKKEIVEWLKKNE
jgi:tRNA C32,U32 (ribose-2'-O)-methylase TrmJ